jgi:hypothetical protein
MEREYISSGTEWESTVGDEIHVSALREYLRDAAHDDDRIGFDDLAALVGHEEAANFRVLKEQLHGEFVDGAADELADS